MNTLIIRGFEYTLNTSGRVQWARNLQTGKLVKIAIVQALLDAEYTPLPVSTAPLIIAGVIALIEIILLLTIPPGMSPILLLLVILATVVFSICYIVDITDNENKRLLTRI